MLNPQLLDGLRSPRIGVLGETTCFCPRGAPWLNVCQTAVGTIPPSGGSAAFLAPSRQMDVLRESRTDLVGIGIAEDDVTARLISCVEALERYAACVWADHEFVVSAPNLMREPHVEIASWPRCAVEEYHDPVCPVVPPDDEKPIRWVRGVDMQTGGLVWVPAGMVFLTLETDRQPFLTCTSGCAAHPTMAGAIRRGLCEVIERDASSLIWIARLPVAPLDERVLDGPTVRLLQTRRARGIRTYLFDATTDLGVPVVLSLDLGPTGEVLLNVSAHPSAVAAAAHCVRETNMPGAIPAWELPSQEAAHCAGDDHGLREAATFLLDGLADRAARAPADIPGSDDVDWTAQIIERLTARSMQAVVVQLTTRELRQVGLVAVKVLVPQLLPYSWHQSAQFRAHPRLIDGVKAMGYSPRAFAEQNSVPQPLA
jgi:ribosomal protein S12 methylthiotransferase accessory factor